MKQHRSWRGWAVGLGLMTAGILTPTACFATPIIDGTLDAEYTQVATSPKDNLLVDPANSIDDPANPSAKSWDSTNLYVANSADALFIFVQLPYYSLTQTQGSWGVWIHLGGANDGKVPSAATIQDSYGAQIYSQHTVAPNALVKSNARSSSAGTDGVGGWGYLNVPNDDGTLWGGWGVGDVFGIQGAPDTSIPNVVRGSKNGFAIAYRQGDGTNGGIEIRLPFVGFNTTAFLSPVVVGDTVQVQFYGTTRADPGAQHKRGAIDCVPFDTASRTDPTQSQLTQWSTPYTIKAAAGFDVVGGQYLTNTTAEMTFSDNLDAATVVPANFTATDVTGGTTVAVTGAAVDGTNPKKAIITTVPMPRGHTVKIEASAAVKSIGGTAVTAGLNSIQFIVPVQVVFTVYDLDDAAAGYEPVTLTGGFVDWVGGAPDPDPREIVLAPVSGQSKTYQSGPVEVRPGRWTYKYRVPKLPGPWDILSRRDFRVDVGTAPLQTLTTDYGSYTTTADVTFTLIDSQNKLAGQDVYMTGNVQETQWSTDTAIMWKLEPVAGKPNTYSTTQPLRDGGWSYKYYVPTASDPWNTMQTEDWYVETRGEGSPLAFNVTNIVPPVTANDILKVVAGISAAPTPASGPDFKAYDKDGNGKIEVNDAVAFVKQ